MRKMRNRTLPITAMFMVSIFLFLPIMTLPIKPIPLPIKPILKINTPSDPSDPISFTEVTSVGVLRSTCGYQRLIRDDFGKYILVYRDRDTLASNPMLPGNKIKIAYSNANPIETSSWIKNITICDGASPNAFLTSPSSLHIVHTTQVNNMIYDQEVYIDRDNNGNIRDVIVGELRILDSDERASGVKGTITNNNNIIIVWSVTDSRVNPPVSFVRSLRYIPGTGWRNIKNTSEMPDVITPDYGQINPLLIPFNFLAVAQNSVNKDIYVLQQHDGKNFFRLIKAKWNGNDWIWQPPIDRFITKYDGVNGDQARPAIFQDPLSGKLIVPIQSKFNGYWDSERKIWFSALRVITIDKTDTKVHLGDDDLDKLPRSTARGKMSVIIDKNGHYYLLFPTDVKRGIGGNLNLIIWNRTSWSSSKVIDSLGYFPSAAVSKVLDDTREFVYTQYSSLCSIKFVRMNFGDKED